MKRIIRNALVSGLCSIGMCDIGGDVPIGSNVDILSGRHQHRSEYSNVSRYAQGGNFTKLRIGRNAWIGNSAVVMADVGGVGEIIDDGQTGFIVPPQVPEAMADRSLRLRTDDSLRHAVGENAGRKARAWFAETTILQQYHNLYSRLTMSIGGDFWSNPVR